MIRGDVTKSASPSRLPIEQERPKPIEHFWWVEEGLVAEEMGVEIPAICGAWDDGPLGWNGDPYRAGSPGSIIATSRPDDCLACLKVLENQVLGRLMLD